MINRLRIGSITSQIEKGESMVKVGDKVKMNDKYRVSEENKAKVFMVKAGPQDICGTMCVWLDGFKGAYAADGLDKVE